MSRYLSNKCGENMYSSNSALNSTGFNNKYEMMEELGNGMHATVYRGKSLVNGNFFALKMTKKTRLRSKREEHNQALINEATILKNLNHKNIVKFYEAFEHSSQIIVVLELIGGGELFQYLSNNEHITEFECKNFAQQILEGIEYMHNKKIVHLDLKPENIMLKDKNSRELVIVDFSLSRMIRPNEKIQLMHGTVEFSAPEIFNFDFIGFYTDMWAFGVILYILFSGYSPFLGDTDIETQTNICQVDINYDIPQLTSLSEDAVNLIKQLLVKDKNKRLSSSDCLKHSWFAHKKKPVNKSRSVSYIETGGLKHFLSRNSMKVQNVIIENEVNEELLKATLVEPSSKAPTPTKGIVCGPPVIPRTRSF